MNQAAHRLALPAGTRLHWYEIREVLGTGGFGITYLAQDLNLDKPVAIKEYLPSEFATRGPDQAVYPIAEEQGELYKWGLDRFIKEARLLSRFEHPNIVRVYTVFEENNTGYMVMAYEHGSSLKAILNQHKTLGEKRLLALVMPILDGLEQIHNQGFIHRDIKPDNIYIREDGSPVLLDFGSARPAAAGDSRTLTTLVSPGYAPFEQYYAKGDEQGPWTDIYSLGATLYRAISGKAPPDAMQRSKALLDGGEDEDSATTLGKDGYSRTLLTAVDHALRFRPADRPQSIRQWREEFSANDDATRIVTPPPDAEPSVPPGSPQRNRLMTSAVVVSLLLVATIGYYVISPSTGDENPPPADTSATASSASNPPTSAEPQSQMQQQAEQARQQAEAKSIAAEKALKEKQAAEAKALAEKKRKEKERRLAEEKTRQEQERLAREKQLQQKIAASRRDFAKRSASKKDTLEYGPSVPSRDLAHLPGNTTTVTVDASKKFWQSSGVGIQRGKTYRITASGKWSMGPLCNTTDATGEGMYTLACWNLGGQTIPPYSHAALIGKIGKDTLAFYVGASLTFTADRNGVLYFLSNDTPAYFYDDKGTLQVTIHQED